MTGPGGTRYLPGPAAVHQDPEEKTMPHAVDFTSVSTAGLESSPVADALAGLRANEARYFWNRYKHEFVEIGRAHV